MYGLKERYILYPVGIREWRLKEKMPSQELLDELKIVMKEDYGVDLGPQDLLEVANGLIGFFEILSESIKKER